MPLFRNNETGQVVRFEGDAALAAVKSGVYAPADDRPVDVTTHAGREVAYAPEDVGVAGAYLPLAGTDPGAGVDEALAEDEARAQQVQYGHGLGQVRAFGEGVLSGATLGLYDVIAPDSSEEFAKANPNARMGGELTGMLAPAIIAPGGGAGRLAAVLGKTPAGYMSAKAAQFGKNIGGVAGTAAGAAAEGAGYAAVQTLSHALVQDEPLAAEAVFAEFGRNALFGAGIGAGAGVLAEGLSRVATKTVGKASETTMPLLNLSSKSAERATKSAGKALDNLDALGDDIIRRFEGKAVKPRIPDVDELPLRKGPLSVDDLPHPSEVPPPVDTPPPAEPNTSWRDPADAPAQRAKIAKSVGDQVWDELLMHNDGAGMGKLRKAWSRADESLKFAKEAKSAGAVSGAHRALDAYEMEVAALAKKSGMDVTEQLGATRRGMEVEGDAMKSLQDFAPAPESVRPPPADPAGFKVNPGSLDQFGQSEPQLIRLEDFKAFGDDLKITRELARKALGATGKYDIYSHRTITELLKKEPAEITAAIARLDDYADALKRTAESLGDARVARRIEKQLLALDDAMDELTDGIKLSDVELDNVGTAIGSESVKAPEFKTGTAERLHNAGTLSKLTHDVKLKPGKTRKSVMRDMVVSASARGAARAGSHMVSGLGGVKGAIAGGIAASTGYNVVHAVANLVGGTGQRITGTISKLTRGGSRIGSKLVRPASLAAAHLIRESSFDYHPDRASKRVKRQSLHEAFRDRAEELARVQANPDAAQKGIHEDLTELRMVAPGVADELEMLSLSVPLYLAGKMPKDPGNVTRFGKSLWRPSDYEILQFGEHIRGAVAPLEVFDEAMQGYITPQAAEAVRTLHPSLFKQMQMHVWENADELRETLDVQEQVRVSVFFDVPVTSIMRPQFRSFMAERLLARAQANAPTGSQLGPSSGGTTPAEPLTGVQQLLK